MDKQEFLEQTIRLEMAAETAYRKLIDLVLAQGRLDASEFFYSMAEQLRLHRESIMQQAGLTALPSTDADAAADDEGSSAQNGNGKDLLMVATEMALAAAQRGVLFYDTLAQAAADVQLRELAASFAAEERTHVTALQQYLGLKPY